MSLKRKRATLKVVEEWLSKDEARVWKRACYPSYYHLVEQAYICESCRQELPEWGDDDVGEEYCQDCFAKCRVCELFYQKHHFLINDPEMCRFCHEVESKKQETADQLVEEAKKLEEEGEVEK